MKSVHVPAATKPIDPAVTIESTEKQSEMAQKVITTKNGSTDFSLPRTETPLPSTKNPFLDPIKTMLSRNHHDTHGASNVNEVSDAVRKSPHTATFLSSLFIAEPDKARF